MFTCLAVFAIPTKTLPRKFTRQYQTQSQLHSNQRSQAREMFRGFRGRKVCNINHWCFGGVTMIVPEPAKSESFTATRNACKMCTPLGACLAFSGIEGCVPFLHGSQGCATYIRRYLISHFREPMDIASSNFGEHAGQDSARVEKHTRQARQDRD